jgi:hypothetical protein
MIHPSLLSLKRTLSFWDEDAAHTDYKCSERNSKRLRNVPVFSSQTAVPTQGAREDSRDDSEECTRADKHDNEARCLQDASLIIYHFKASTTKSAGGISTAHLARRRRPAVMNFVESVGSRSQCELQRIRRAEKYYL